MNEEWERNSVRKRRGGALCSRIGIWNFPQDDGMDDASSSRWDVVMMIYLRVSRPRIFLCV